MIILDTLGHNKNHTQQNSRENQDQEQPTKTKETQPNQKKRNLMKLCITSTLNHVLQSIPLSPKQLERLEKERNKAFWAKEDNQTVNKGRTKVSKHRINGPIEIGGLNLTSIECMYRSLRMK